MDQETFRILMAVLVVVAAAVVVFAIVAVRSAPKLNPADDLIDDEPARVHPLLRDYEVTFGIDDDNNWLIVVVKLRGPGWYQHLPQHWGVYDEDGNVIFEGTWTYDFREKSMVLIAAGGNARRQPVTATVTMAPDCTHSVTPVRA